MKSNVEKEENAILSRLGATKLRRRVELRAAALEITKSEIASRMGISSQSFSGILTTSNPRADTLFRLGEALDVPVGYFLDDGGFGGELTWKMLAVSESQEDDDDDDEEEEENVEE